MIDAEDPGIWKRLIPRTSVRSGPKSGTTDESAPSPEIIDAPEADGGPVPGTVVVEATSSPGIVVVVPSGLDVVVAISTVVVDDPMVVVAADATVVVVVATVVVVKAVVVVVGAVAVVTVEFTTLKLADAQVAPSCLHAYIACPPAVASPGTDTLTTKVLPDPGWTVPRLAHPDASQHRETENEEGNPLPTTWTVAPGGPDAGLS